MWFRKEERKVTVLYSMTVGQAAEGEGRVDRFSKVSTAATLLSGIITAVLLGILFTGALIVLAVMIGIGVIVTGVLISRSLIQKIPTTFKKGKDHFKYPEIREKMSDGWKDHKEQ